MNVSKLKLIPIRATVDKFGVQEIPNPPLPNSIRFCAKCGFIYNNHSLVSYLIGYKYPTCWKCGAVGTVMYCNDYITEFGAPPDCVECERCEDRFDCWAGNDQ